ncbi:proP, partial [Symbiodinium pilosum]
PMPVDVEIVEEAPAKQSYAGDMKSFLSLTWPLLLGNMLEWYEFGIYGYVEKEIAENFFDGSSEDAWLGFAITFVARPMGGFLLGYIADNCGRKLSVLISLGGMILATVGQGLLPGKYFGADARHFGLGGLVCCRVLQGISAGGEIGAVSAYLVEVSPIKTLGMAVCMISVGSQIAWAFASLLVALLSSALTHQQMLEWGWRIPFLLAAIPGIISVVGRKRIPETETFLEIAAEGATSKSGFGFVELIK